MITQIVIQLVLSQGWNGLEFGSQRYKQQQQQHPWQPTQVTQASNTGNTRKITEEQLLLTAFLPWVKHLTGNNLQTSLMWLKQ